MGAWNKGLISKLIFFKSIKNLFQIFDLLKFALYKCSVL